MPKFLIIRFSSIGDIVLTTPVIRCLKKQVDGAEVHMVTKRSFRSLFDANPYVDKLHVLEDDLEACIEQLKQEQFDYVIDLHHNLRTLKVKRALGVKSFSFNKVNTEKWLLTALKINRLPEVHIVDRYLETVSSFGVRNDGLGLDYFIPEGGGVDEHDIPHGHIAGYIAVVIGAAHATKQMPVSMLTELCTKIDHPVILIGGPEDRANGEQIAAADPVKIYNACGKFNLHESADLVKRAKLVISHDTGMMHIAATFRKPIISIWGNTVPEFGMTPYYGHIAVPNHISQVEKLWCRPCSKIGYNKCPLGHFNCMKRQSINALLTKVNEMLGR